MWYRCKKNFFFENPFTISPVYIALIWPLLKYIRDLIVLTLFCQYKTTFVRNHFEVVCKLVVVLLHLCLNPTNAGRYIFVMMICSYITAVLKSHLSFYPNFTFNCMISIPTFYPNFTFNCMLDYEVIWSLYTPLFNGLRICFSWEENIHIEQVLVSVTLY